MYINDFARYDDGFCFHIERRFVMGSSPYGADDFGYFRAADVYMSSSDYSAYAMVSYMTVANDA